MDQNLDGLIKSMTKKLFLKKDGVNLEDAHILASMITAASKMAICADGGNEYETMDELLDLYGKTGDKNVSDLIGMGPQYVRSNIGFSVDFMDYSCATAAYLADKDQYDQYYGMVHMRSETRNKGQSL